MIKKDTIVSTTDGRLTLLQWLKKVEKALKDSTVTGFTATPTEDGKVVFAMTFADGSTIAADPIAVPAALDEVIKYNKAGGRVKVGADLDVEGAAIFIGGRSYRLLQSWTSNSNNIEFQNQTPEGLFSSALKIVAKNDGSYSLLLHNVPIATKNDLNDLRMDVSATYSKARYQHTVHITALSDTNKQLNVSFTAKSSTNTPVVSYQKLHEVFGGRNLTVSGLIKYWAMGVPIYLDLHGGTIETDKLYFVDASSAGAYQQPTLSEFPNIAFTDDVVPD